MLANGLVRLVCAFTFLPPSLAALLPHLDNLANVRALPYSQVPMDAAPGIQLPPPKQDPTQPTGDVLLSDVMGSQRGINIFASFTRDIASVATRLDTSSENTTVLAPLNSIISALPRKPWEDPKEYEQLGTDAYAGDDGEKRALANMKRFTETHVVPQSPWAANEKVEAMGGNTVWWEEKDGKSFIQPGDIEVEKVVSRVANGQIWVLKGVVNYAS